MIRKSQAMIAMVLVAGSLSVIFSGCARYDRMRAAYETPPVPSPLGTITNSIWQRQESNAEGADFIVYEHEFKKDDIRLNRGGEDHLKQMATRLCSGQSFPVVIEMGTMGVQEGTEFELPIHPNPELDYDRREIVVRLLLQMGVKDADKRVLVAPSYVCEYGSTEAINAYLTGYVNQGSGRGGGFFGGGGFGGGGFGGGGFGGGGGGGGGFGGFGGIGGF
jgi:uncharacterized membrane protein YgcG